MKPHINAPSLREGFLTPGVAVKLHVFDMDGTLLNGSACLELCRHVGRLDEVLEAEEAWGRGEVGHVQFYELLLGLWEDLDDADVASVVEASPWLQGIREVCADIRSRGELSCVISMSPQFFVDYLLAWGFDRTYGARVHPAVPLRPEDVLLPEGKVEVVERLLSELGIDYTDVVGYGDSASDIPLFGRLAHSVAVNGTYRLLEVAEASYEGDDIWDAYQIGRRLLSPPASSATRGCKPRSGHLR